jgi:RNA polymerase sigma-70 factor, ECF subfamily
VARLDQAAFTAFYGSHAPRLWAYVYRVTGNGADADDIVQEAFLRLLRSGPDTEDEEQRRRFLYRVASNLVIDRWRRRKREDPGDARPAAVSQAVEPDDDVARTFAQLTPRDRALLWLAYVEGASHKEIASALAVGTRSIKVLLFRARRRLRDLLHAKGLSRNGDEMVRAERG